jgi:hypothetical protein
MDMSMEIGGVISTVVVPRGSDAALAAVNVVLSIGASKASAIGEVHDAPLVPLFPT